MAQIEDEATSMISEDASILLRLRNIEGELREHAINLLHAGSYERAKIVCELLMSYSVTIRLYENPPAIDRDE